MSSAPALASWFAVAALLVGGAVAGGLWASRRQSPVTPAAGTVAILPFAVSGGARVEFLGTGMVDLLSTSLDGAGGRHTVDPRVVMAAAGPAVARHPVTPGEGRDIALRIGASHYVLGTVVSAGDRVHVSAVLYDVRRGDTTVARASAAGSEANLFDVVDRLTAQLAVAQDAAAGERLTQLASVTTTSLEALKAFLAGRSAYRANDLYLALSSFQRAVGADSTFALAWYALASTASWMMRPDLERQSAAEAVRQGSRLAPRDRALVEAFAAYSRGAADSAEALASSIAQRYDDVEAWVLVGEVLYHHNWKRGRSLVESRYAWQRVLALDSTYWPALEHLAEVTAVEGHPKEADALLARYQRTVGADRMMLASRAMRGYAFRDSSSRDAVAAQLATDRGFWLTLSVWYVSVIGRDIHDAQLLARHLVEPTRSAEQQSFGRILLAHLALARGRWIEARNELALARINAPADALEYELLLAMAPFLSTPPDELERLADALPLPAAAVTDNSVALAWPNPQSRLHRMTRSYLVGMTAARAGHDGRRLRSLTELAKMPDPTLPTALAAGFALSIRAEHERMASHPAAALALLERARRETPFVAAWTSGFVSQARERYVRAELLRELGRDDEALRWYATFDENSPYDLVYLAPALYRQAQIHDRHGDSARAVAAYSRFVELWKDCDPALQPLVTDAQRRIVALR